MPITNDQKREIANALGVHPSHYFTHDNLIDSKLYVFGGIGHLSFKYSEQGQTNPGIGFYVDNGMRATYTQQFAQIQLPPDFFLNNGQAHVGGDDGGNGNGWITFCKNGVENQQQAYADIVYPGKGVEAWKNLLATLRDSIGAIVQVPATPFGPQGQNDPAVPSPAPTPSHDIVQPPHDIVQPHPFNWLVFGAPGTGKSHSLKAAYEGDDAPFLGRYERVTFYSTYSYAQFVGSYKPIMKKGVGEQEGEQERIAYKFVPGPFLRMLVKAANNPDQNYLLIIEEINRANAAAVFGDVFQLLDRTKAGESEYPIGASEDVVRYLEEDADLNDNARGYFNLLDGSAKLKLPKNLYIWATMNSADQGVFPLDTAFKRRWSFQYMGIDEGENSPAALNLAIRGYAWKTLRKFLNRLLVLNGANEDKLMGPFFLKDASEFESKVLMYLWEDAARMCRRAVFGQIKTYSELCAAWAKDGIKIFDEAKFDDDELTNLRNSLNGQTEHA